MTRVTLSECRRLATWYWSVEGLGGLASRCLQHKLDKKSAGRGSCCENEELMSDLWFDGFPELIERKQVILALYQKQEQETETKPLSVRKRPVLHSIKLHWQKDKVPSRHKNARTASDTKAAA